MSNRQFVRLRAGRVWHIVGTPTRLINGYRTFCGRLVVGYPVDALPTLRSRVCRRCAA